MNNEAVSAPFLRVRNLHRRFDSVVAVQDVSFEISRGKVVGFIGANGAGKTTTMRLLATLDQPDGGQIELDGCDVVEEPARVRRVLGWMPDHTGTYSLTSVLEYLDFFTRANSLRGKTRRERIHEVVEFVGLEDLLERPMVALSKGEAQRLALARTLLHDPALLILDEPAAGLDPKARVEFRKLISFLREQGKTVLISSHILSELGEMCDDLLFIHKGRMVHHGTADSLKRSQRAGVRVLIEVAGDTQALYEWLVVHPGWQLDDRMREGARADFADGSREALSNELRQMVLDGVKVASFRVEERKLEDAFVELLGTLSEDATPTSAQPGTREGGN